MQIKYKNCYIIENIVGTDYKSNSYIIWNIFSKHAIIIDPNIFLPISDRIEKHQLHIDYILITHEHYDHIAALHKIKRYFGGKVITSKNCKNEMSKTQDILNKTYRLHMYFIGKQAENSDIPQYETEKVDITFCNKMKLKWENLLFHMRETIGHSKGSISILLDNAYIFSGDAVLEGKPIISNYLGGNKEEYKKNTTFYYQQLDKNLIVLPGHGELFKLKDKKLL